MREHPILSHFLAEADSGHATTRSLAAIYALILSGGDLFGEEDRATALAGAGNALGLTKPGHFDDFIQVAERMLDRAALRCRSSAEFIRLDAVGAMQ